MDESMVHSCKSCHHPDNRKCRCLPPSAPSATTKQRCSLSYLFEYKINIFKGNVKFSCFTLKKITLYNRVVLETGRYKSYILKYQVVVATEDSSLINQYEEIALSIIKVSRKVNLFVLHLAPPMCAPASKS